MLLEASRMSIDDAKKSRSSKATSSSPRNDDPQGRPVVITEDQYGSRKAPPSAANGLARFRQKREGKDEYIDGEAERIEYNTNSELPNCSTAPG